MSLGHSETVTTLLGITAGVVPATLLLAVLGYITTAAIFAIAGSSFLFCVTWRQRSDLIGALPTAVTCTAHPHFLDRQCDQYQEQLRYDSITSIATEGDYIVLEVLKQPITLPRRAFDSPEDEQQWVQFVRDRSQEQQASTSSLPPLPLNALRHDPAARLVRDGWAFADDDHIQYPKAQFVDLPNHDADPQAKKRRGCSPVAVIVGAGFGLILVTRDFFSNSNCPSRLTGLRSVHWSSHVG